MNDGSSIRVWYLDDSGISLAPRAWLSRKSNGVLRYVVRKTRDGLKWTSSSVDYRARNALLIFFKMGLLIMIDCLPWKRIKVGGVFGWNGRQVEFGDRF